MSGIFLITARENPIKDDPVLKNTTGGYPHLTFAYSGSKVSLEELLETGTKMLRMFALSRATLTHAVVNSFRCGSKMRHDVLLYFDHASENAILAARGEELDARYSTNKPHVSHAYFDDLVEAKRASEEVQKYLPLEVQFTGLTVD